MVMNIILPEIYFCLPNLPFRCSDDSSDKMDVNSGAGGTIRFKSGLRAQSCCEHVITSYFQEQGIFCII